MGYNRTYFSQSNDSFAILKYNALRYNKSDLNIRIRLLLNIVTIHCNNDCNNDAQRVFSATFTKLEFLFANILALQK